MTWTPSMVEALRKMRAGGTAIYWCAFDIGVSYKAAVLKCRELGIADRRNRGRTTGEAIVRAARS
jgi:hypothetical protein